MKRVDRATYVVFLLVLLADVVWAHSSVPVHADGSGNLILRAAGQMQQRSAVQVLQRSAKLGRSSFRISRLGGFRFSAGKPWLVSGLSSGLGSAPMLLTALAMIPDLQTSRVGAEVRNAGLPACRYVELAGDPSP